MVSKTKSKTKKRGKQSRGSKKAKPLKKSSLKRTHTSAKPRRKTSRKSRNIVAASSSVSPSTIDERSSINEGASPSSSAGELNSVTNETHENPVLDTEYINTANNETTALPIE
jgi:hypothetical protein